jgi:ABC-type transport system substrate-binding protein
MTIPLLVHCTKRNEVSENTIQFPLRINLSSLDSAQSSNEATTEVVSNIYEGLLQYSYLKRPLTVEPLLADGMPEVSKDGLTYMFKIKPGVKFQDSEAFKDKKGREVTANDFIYSWKRLADPKTKSEGWWIFDGKVKGFNDWRDKLMKNEASYDTPIEGLQAVDDHTLKITLTKPYYQLEYVLAMPYAAVVPKEAIDKWGSEFMNHPVGTGPFVFETWIRGNKVILKKNPSWHGGTYPTEGEKGDEEKGLLADAGKPLPFIDGIVFHEVPEDQPRWLNLMKGAYDFAGIPKDNFDAAMASPTELKPELAAKGLRLIVYPYPDVVYIGYNMQDPILGKNLNLRLALCYAYDQKTASEKFYNNRVVTAYSPISPGMEGYDPNFRSPCKEYNLAKAKELMKKAGYPDGKGLPPLEYSFAGSTTGRQMAEYNAQQFEKIGVKLNLVSNSWPQFQDRLRNKKSQMFGIAWGADYPDPENMFQILYGPNESPGPNSSNWHNKEFDELYVKASKTPPGPVRAKIYQKMRDIFVKEQPWLTTVHRLGYLITHDWVGNLKPHETIKGTYKYLKIDMNKKTEAKKKL